MLVKNVVRGNSVTFTTGFYDANNDLVIPSLPTLTVHYKANNQYVTETANMSGSGASWTATWDSSNADVGIVDWHISAGAGLKIASDGSFRIYANKANANGAGGAW